MAAVQLSRAAVDDLDSMIATHGLPADTRARVGNSLRVLETFPRIGPELRGGWRRFRFLIGPWPWMILVYMHEETADLVTVVAIHDGRSSTAAAGR